MRLILTAAALALTTACGSSTPTAGSIAAEQVITAPQADTKVVAVLSYASWCGSCKALDPKVKAVQAGNTFGGVEFFALDYSAKDEAAFYADAETLGVAETFRAEFAEQIKTGKLYLIDTSTGAILGRLDKSMDEAAITAAITAAVSAT